MSSPVAFLIGETLRAFSPPKKLTCSQWADEFAYLSPESSADPGKWHTLPYQKGILDAITDPTIERITVAKSARVGYTKIVNHAIGFHIHQDPCPIMVVQPTIEDAEGYSKEEIAPMVRDTPVLRALVSDSKARNSDSTILQKKFPGGVLSMVGANSARGFRRVSRRVVIFDEVDGYPPSAGAEGDQIKLGIRRTEYYWNRKIIEGSTPTIKGLSRIENSYLDTDQRRFFVPCPHCQGMQVLKWGGPDKPYGFKWPKDKPGEVEYLCEHCGALIAHSHKRDMVTAGEWRSTTESKNPKHVGFHIWAAYSFSPNATWAQIVEEFIESKSDPLKLKTWVNTVLGETWEEQGDAIEAETLSKRLEVYAAEVPNGAAVLTCAVDVQGDRLEAKIKAYGNREESWLIAFSQFHGDPSADAVWHQLDEFRRQEFTHESGRVMKVRVCLVDSGGHHTEAVYRYCKPRERENVFPIKGSSIAGREVIGRPSKNNRYRVNLFPVGSDTAKEIIYSRLRIFKPGPGYMHLAEGIADTEYLEQLTAEKALRKYKKGVGMVKEWVKIRERNEALDLEVYALAALYLLGASFVKALGDLALSMSAPLDQKPVEKQAEATGFKAETRQTGTTPRGIGGGGWVNGWKK